MIYRSKKVITLFSDVITSDVRLVLISIVIKSDRREREYVSVYDCNDVLKHSLSSNAFTRYSCNIIPLTLGSKYSSL